MEERIVELEIRSAFQEEKLRQLSDVLYAQQKAIDRLSDALKATERRLSAGAASDDGPAGDGPGEGPDSNEKPPHY